MHSPSTEMHCSTPSLGDAGVKAAASLVFFRGHSFSFVLKLSFYGRLLHSTFSQLGTDIIARIKNLTKRLKKLKEEHFDTLRGYMAIEFLVAWERRQSAACWRLARRMRFNRLGPKRGNLQRSTNRPLSSVFVSRLALPGGDIRAKTQMQPTCDQTAPSLAVAAASSASSVTMSA